MSPLRPHPEAPPYLQRIAVLALLSAVVAAVLLVMTEGYGAITSRWGRHAVTITWLAAVGLGAFYELLLIYRAVHRLDRVKSLAFDLVALGAVVILAVAGRSGLLALAVFIFEVAVAVRVFGATRAGARVLLGLLTRPAQLIASSFLVVIFLGTVVLTFPRATTDGEGAPLVDALFTATSATCVTGLAVMNTNGDEASNPDLQTFSAFGQLVILVLIQIGGLGIMTLSAAVVLLLGRRLGLQSQALLQDVLEESSRKALEQSVRYIFLMTLIIEGIGALLLFFPFLARLDDFEHAAAHAVFMAISAYCNAGFSLWSDSLMSFQSNYTVLLTIMGLITLGGLGPLVVAALMNRENLRRYPNRTWRSWPMHVRIVLFVSVSLVVGGAIVYYYFDFHASLKHLGRDEKVLSAIFQSVTMRTAGFNTVDHAEMSRVTMIVMVILMFIGGSSGSTAGGVKTSTVAVVFLGVRAMLLGRDDVEAFGRTVPKVTVYKAISILVIFVGLFVFGLLGLLILEEDKHFEPLLFETMSALATVGVSQGVTPELSVGGRLLVVFLMFVGRIGPLTLALAVGERRARVSLRYPEGRIVVG